jgi:hypothetical protein
LTDEWSIGADYGRKFDGKNTAKSDFFALSLEYAF